MKIIVNIIKAILLIATIAFIACSVLTGCTPAETAWTFDFVLLSTQIGLLILLIRVLIWMHKIDKDK